MANGSLVLYYVPNSGAGGIKRLSLFLILDHANYFHLL